MKQHIKQAEYKQKEYKILNMAQSMRRNLMSLVGIDISIDHLFHEHQSQDNV
jgi:predicted metal-dependent peptidase